ncbi:hypothetical protein BJ912DRAFT_932917 [Pholiota molesta]|nr:hypothetical protein BJ912DRAFT_932917 [Pholiota molesta]
MCTSTALTRPPPSHVRRPCTPPPSCSAALARPPPSCSTALAHPPHSCSTALARPPHSCSTALARPLPLRIHRPCASATLARARARCVSPRCPPPPPPLCTSTALACLPSSCSATLMLRRHRVPPPLSSPVHRVPQLSPFSGGVRGEREGEESGGVGGDVTHCRPTSLIGGEGHAARGTAAVWAVMWRTLPTLHCWPTSLVEGRGTQREGGEESGSVGGGVENCRPTSLVGGEGHVARGRQRRREESGGWRIGDVHGGLMRRRTYLAPLLTWTSSTSTSPTSSSPRPVAVHAVVVRVVVHVVTGVVVGGGARAVILEMSWRRGGELGLVVVVVEAKRGKDLEIILSPACYGTTNIRGVGIAWQAESTFGVISALSTLSKLWEMFIRLKAMSRKQPRDRSKGHPPRRLSCISEAGNGSKEGEENEIRMQHICKVWNQESLGATSEGACEQRRDAHPTQEYLVQATSVEETDTHGAACTRTRDAAEAQQTELLPASGSRLSRRACPLWNAKQVDLGVRGKTEGIGRTSLGTRTEGYTAHKGRTGYVA